MRIARITFNVEAKIELQRVREAGITHGSVDFFVEVGFLKLEGSGVVLDLGVGVVLDVHRGLLALGLADTCISVGLKS